MSGPMEDFYRIRRLPPYVFEQVNRAKAAARNAGADIIDLGIAADTIAAYDYVKKRCKAFWDLRGIEFFFWSRRSEGRRFSELARSKVWFRDLACG